MRYKCVYASCAHSVSWHTQSRYELDRNCERAVRILDEATVEVDGHHGPKQFVFDSVFAEQHSQEAVFEDTRRLVQSALDGYARECHKTALSTIDVWWTSLPEYPCLQ